METINNVVNSASKAIFGESNETAGREPVSGKQGAGTATEPYDAGNGPTPLATPLETPGEAVGKEPVSGFLGKGTASEPFDQGNAADSNTPAGKADLAGATTLPIREKPTEATSKPVGTADSFNSAAAANASVAAHTTAITSITTASSDIKPTTTDSDIKPTSNTATSGLQGSDVPEAAPNATETAAINAKTEKAEALLDKDGNANPPAKDSNEGKTERIVEDKVARKDSKEPKDDKVVTKDVNKVDDKPKTTSTSSAGAKSSSGASPGSSEKEKVSKMERLKEKLHIGHKHKDETK